MLLLAGCECGAEPPVDGGPIVEPPVELTPEERVMRGEGVPRIEGRWVDAPEGLTVTDLVAGGERALVGGRVGEHPVLHWVDAELSLRPGPEVPPPSRYGRTWEGLEIGEVDPALALDGEAVAVTLVEYQGGSFGIVIFPDARARTPQVIESPTDSDIAFGQPLLLRGDDLFTLESPGGKGGALWHYRRSRSRSRGRTRIRWSGTQLAFPLAERTELDWGLALSADAQMLACTTAPAEGTVELYRRAGSSYEHARTIAVPEAPTGLGFHAEGLVVGFVRPQPDHSSLWILHPEDGAVRQRILLPLEQNQTAVHSLDLAGDLAIVGQLRQVVVADLAEGRARCILEVPPPARGRPSYPIAAAAEGRVFVATRRRLGVFDLASCSQ